MLREPIEADEDQAREEAFGAYVLRREIASGGMATVYEAARRGDDGFERRVAIKRIHPHLAKDRAFVEMFLDEARLAARIAHPNVCQVIDYGKHAGASFLAMEFLDGRPLHRIAAALARRDREGDAHLRFVATVVLEAAEGLHAAHELRGEDGARLDVVHRDVSPQNLFVTFEGEVKVVDFGVASARDKTHRTETGNIKGKLAYMSPEQVAGQVDRRTDVWALGVVLWELLTLRRLFRRDTPPETIVAIERDAIAPPSSVRPGLGDALDEVVRAALERDLEARTRSARSLARALSAALEPLGGPLSRLERAAQMLELFELEAGEGPDSEVRTKPAGRARRAAEERDTEARPAPEPKATTAAAAPAKPPPAVWWGALVAVPLAIAGGFFAVLGREAIPEEPPARPEAPAASLEAPTALEASDEATPPPTTEAPTTEAPATEAPPPAAPERPPARAPREPAAAPPATPTVRSTAAPSADREVPERASPAPASPPPPEPAPPGEPGRVTVPMGVTVCFDRPCSDRSDAIYGPRRVTLPGGPHRVHYLETPGPSSGPATVLRVGEVVVTPGETVVLPR